VQAATSIANRLGQRPLDAHVDVLVFELKGKVAPLNAGGYGIEPRLDVGNVGGGDDALRREHPRVRL
jgi:hypothetical protein